MDECRSAGQMSEGALAPEFLSGRHSSVWRREPAVARSAMAGKTAGDHALGGRPLGRARGRAGCGAAGPATAGFDRSSGTAAREYWFLCSFKTSTRGSRPPTAPYSFPAKRVSRNAFLLAEGTIDGFVHRRDHAVTVPALSTFCGAHPLGAPRRPAGFVMTPKDQPSAFGTRLALPGPRAAIRGRDPGNFGSRQKVRRPAGRDPPAFKLLSQTKKPGGFALRRRQHGDGWNMTGKVLPGARSRKSQPRVLPPERSGRFAKQPDKLSEGTQFPSFCPAAKRLRSGGYLSTR